MSETEDVYRLEGSQNETGGLIIRKKASDHTFKKPQTSALGLDKLAQKIRNEKEKKYRAPQEETPTYTAGVNREARERLESRMKRQRLDAHEGDRYRDRDRNRDRRRNDDRDRDKDHRRNYSSRSSSSRDSSRQTPRFRDEPQTPKYRAKVLLINRS